MNNETYKIIPDSVFFCTEISDKAKLLYGLILALSKDTGVCWATNSYLASQLNCTKKYISTLVAELKRKGFIDSIIEYKTDSKEIENRYLKILGYPIPQIKDASFKNSGEGIPQFWEENNINIINNIVEKTSTSQNYEKQVEEIVDYLNLKTGKNFKVKSKNTIRLISARLKEDYTIEDFKRVIDNQVTQWSNDKTMQQYLRPETLFAPSHFESYLNSNTTLSTNNWNGINEL